MPYFIEFREIMSCKPKYSYGLLDTPESSAVSVFDSTIQSTLLGANKGTGKM